MHKLFFDEKGQGKKSVLFFHGLWGGGNYLRDFSLIPNTYRQYFPDQLGFGRSPKPAITYSIKLHCQLIESIIPKNERVTLVGHSFGGTLALNFADLYPNRVNNIILISPLIYKDTVDAITHLSTNFISRLTIKHPSIAKVICNSLCSTRALGRISPLFVSKQRKNYIGGCTEHTWNSFYSTFTNCLLENHVANITKKAIQRFPFYILYGNSDGFLNYPLLNDLKCKKTMLQGDHYVLFERLEKCKTLIAEHL